ncbi:hypothetical protein R615_06525 [Thalassolituus oleivorans R6-15]|nr:hypothetical protein R615_06525 [Thalassolituus oleivorans R6-15]
MNFYNGDLKITMLHTHQAKEALWLGRRQKLEDTNEKKL